jgi:hypothetical protein
MTDFRQQAQELLSTYELCMKAKPRHDAVNVQLEKDAVTRWATHLNYQLGWGTDNDIAEACYQLESRLRHLKEKLVMEILQHGAV